MKRERLLTLTQELIEARGPSGREDEVRAIVLRELEPLCDEVWVDEAGNAVGRIQGGGAAPKRKKASPAPVIRVMAHLDELAMTVKRIEADGTLRVRPLGGMEPWVFGLGAVEVMGERRVLPGVLSVGSLHTTAESPESWQTKSKGRGKTLDWPQLHVFTRKSPAELERAGVHPGSHVVLARSRRGLLELGDCIGGYFLDDRVCLTIMLAAAAMLKEKRKRPAGDVYLIGTCQEEISGGLAAYAARRLPGEVTLAVDVGPVAKEYGTRLDEQPIVVYRDGRSLYSKRVSDRLVALARALKLKPQRAAFESYGSDASCAKTAGHAPQAGLLCIPTENTHGFEIVPKKAIENCARVLAGYLERPR